MGRLFTGPSKDELLCKIKELSSRQAVADYYGVNFSTFWRWCKKYRIKRGVSGVMHWGAALTKDDVILCRALISEGASHSAVAKKLNVNPGVIGRLARYETYINIME